MAVERADEAKRGVDVRAHYLAPRLVGGLDEGLLDLDGRVVDQGVEPVGERGVLQ
jgi:hypothetical protein